MAEVNELLERIRTNIDMAQLYGGAYFNEARRLLMNDLVDAIDEIRAEQSPSRNGSRPAAVERETARPVAKY
jgi:hypothetical protein